MAAVGMRVSKCGFRYFDTVIRNYSLIFEIFNHYSKICFQRGCRPLPPCCFTMEGTEFSRSRIGCCLLMTFISFTEAGFFLYHFNVARFCKKVVR